MSEEGFFQLSATITAPDGPTALRAVLGSGAAAGFGVASWAVPANAPARVDDLERAEISAEAIAAGGAHLFFDRENRATLFMEGPASWVLTLKVYRPGRSHNEMAFDLGRLARMCRGLAQTDLVRAAKVTRLGTGPSCVPGVPIALVSHVVLTDEGAVADAYDEPGAFLQAGWDSFEPIGDLLLLARGLGRPESAAFLAHIIGPQWEMAHAARPGLTQYWLPNPAPDERPIFYAGEPTLTPVGHITELNTVEYVAHVPDSAHIRGWEIYMLRELAMRRQLDDGTPFDGVRVVFLTREVAERERRPLLDVGVRVYYQGDAGELVEVDE